MKMLKRDAEIMRQKQQKKAEQAAAGGAAGGKKWSESILRRNYLKTNE